MALSNSNSIDHYDSRILAQLQADARISMSELGRRVHLSQPAVTERVRKLELCGVIKGYRAVVDVARLGYGIRAMVRVGRCDYATVVKRIEETPEVINGYNLTGEDSWILEIAVQDVPHLDEVVSKFCLLTETSTSIILTAVRENHALLPALAPRAKPGFEKYAARDSAAIRLQEKKSAKKSVKKAVTKLVTKPAVKPAVKPVLKTALKNRKPQNARPH